MINQKKSDLRSESEHLLLTPKIGQTQKRPDRESGCFAKPSRSAIQMSANPMVAGELCSRNTGMVDRLATNGVFVSGCLEAEI